MTQEKFQEIVSYLTAQSPELGKFVEGYKHNFMEDTVKNHANVEWLIYHKCVCFIEAVLAFKSASDSFHFSKSDIKKEYEEMSKNFQIILNENSKVKPNSFNIEMIEFNWPEIRKYVNSMAEKYHFKKLSINDSITIPLNSLNKIVVVIEEGPLGEESHYSVTTLGNIANRYRYKPVYVFVKEED